MRCVYVYVCDCEQEMVGGTVVGEESGRGEWKESGSVEEGRVGGESGRDSSGRGEQ